MGTSQIPCKTIHKGGWPYGGYVPHPLQIYLTRGDGHTVGSSQTPCNLEQGWMAIRWAHAKYLATFEQGWMAIRWAHPRFLAKQFTGVDGHTVGTSQTPCKTIYKDWVAIRWAHPNYLVPLKQIIHHTVGRCLRMVSDVFSKTTAQDNNACDCRQGWMATRWAHPRMLS